MESLTDKQRRRQIDWRNRHVSTSEEGWQNGGQYPHILPRRIWEENLWQGIRKELPAYLKHQDVKPHTGVHNLMSSWVVAANLYFPLRDNASLRRLMVGFLQTHMSPDIEEIINVELEYALDGHLAPEALLGETGGSRGSGQTSPDVAFEVRTKHGTELILVECKFTEHSFYNCSARTEVESDRRLANPDRSRCMVAASSQGFSSICHQNVWGRKYWNHLELTEHGKQVLTRCPAATGGYQLFRQQALANGILKHGPFAMVASCVAFDRDNQSLKKSLLTTGIKDFETEWPQLFNDDVVFRTWYHQDWIAYVRSQDSQGEHAGWLGYLEERYGY